MPYVPNNAVVYNAGLFGVGAAYAQLRFLQGTTPLKLAGVAATAAAFAVALDMQFEPGTVSGSVAYTTLSELVAGTLGTTVQTDTDPDHYDALALGVATLYSTLAATTVPDPSSTGATTGIVFRPGAPSVGNTYATSAEVRDAIAACNGACSVYIDGSLIAPATPSMDPGVVWDLQRRGSLVGAIVTNTSNYVLKVPDGAQIRNAASFRSLALALGCTTLPSLDWSDWEQGPVLTLELACNITMLPEATISPIFVPNTVSNFFETLFMDGSTYNPDAGSPTLPLVTLQGGTGGPGTGAKYLIAVTNQVTLAGTLPATLFSGDATTAYVYIADASGYPEPVWVATSKVISGPFRMYSAIGVGYTAADPSKWAGTPPGNAADAIDRIAAVVGGVVPIP